MDGSPISLFFSSNQHVGRPWGPRGLMIAQEMESDVPIQLVLVNPPADVDYGIQKGSGARYETLFVQRRGRGDVCFRFSLKAKDTGKDGLPHFQGPLAQGTPANRFLYVDVGTYAGQKDTPWA